MNGINFISTIMFARLYINLIYPFFIFELKLFSLNLDYKKKQNNDCFFILFIFSPLINSTSFAIWCK